LTKTKLILSITLILIFGIISVASGATNNNQNNEATDIIKWLGHSTCLITTEKGTNILIDPWITGNPVCPVSKEEIKPDIILVTHDHFDHIGTDIPYLTKGSNRVVIVNYDVAPKLIESGVDAKNIITNGMGMNIGGQVEIKGIKVTMTEATHSANSVGYIITLEDGKTIYHAGDTGLFGGMELLGDLYDIDLAFIPIGNIFTMDPLQAAYSLTLLKPKKVVPIHYGGFEILTKDPAEFVKFSKEKAPNVDVTVLSPGEKITLDNK